MRMLAILAALQLAGCTWAGSIGFQQSNPPPTPPAIVTLITGLSEAQTVRSLERQLAR
jgi:hypothetical protein